MSDERDRLTSPRYPLQLLALTLVNVSTGWFGLSLASQHENATLIWGPTGVSLAALILFGWRLWPGVLMGTIGLSLLRGTPAGPALVMALGNTLEALMGALVLVHVFALRPSLDRVRDVLLLLVVGGVFASMLSAGMGVTGLWLAGRVPGPDVANVMLIWWRGNLGGVVVVTSFLLLLHSGRPSWSVLVRRHEFWIIGALLLVSYSLVYSAATRGQWQALVFQLPLACLVWACLRLGPRGAFGVAFSTLAIAAVATSRDVGPFSAVEDPHLSTSLLWTYGMVMGVTALILAAVVAQRDESEEQRGVEMAERVKIERQQLLAQERQRLTRDMHDGLGGQLVSILSMVQRGQASDAEVAEALRRTVEDMRMMMDSLEVEEIVFSELLGRLRARLQPLLDRNGLQLQWRVSESALLDSLAPEQALHAHRIIQEAVANVVQHAQASEVSVDVSVRDDDGGVIAIEIRDNGVGLNSPEPMGGRGLGNMRARAAALGAELKLGSADPGCLVRLLIPVGANPA